MSTARRTALVSLVGALVLALAKLVVGLATGSLGILAEAAHSGIDAVAALLTVYAVGVAERPADPEHPYGHGKAQHLSALAEAAILAGVAVWIAVEAITRLIDGSTCGVGHLVCVRADGRGAGGRCRPFGSVAAGGQSRAQRGAARQRRPLCLGLRRQPGGAGRLDPGRLRGAGRRLGGRDLRLGDRARRRGSAGLDQHRGADGPGPDRDRRPGRAGCAVRAGGDRGALGAGARGRWRELRRGRDRCVTAGGLGALARHHGSGGAGGDRGAGTGPGGGARRARRGRRACQRSHRGRGTEGAGRGRDAQHHGAGTARRPGGHAARAAARGHTAVGGRRGGRRGSSRRFAARSASPGCSPMSSRRFPTPNPPGR